MAAAGQAASLGDSPWFVSSPKVPALRVVGARANGDCEAASNQSGEKRPCGSGSNTQMLRDCACRHSACPAMFGKERECGAVASIETFAACGRFPASATEDRRCCPYSNAEVGCDFLELKLPQSCGETRLCHASHTAAPLLHPIQFLKEACDDAISAKHSPDRQ